MEQKIKQNSIYNGVFCNFENLFNGMDGKFNSKITIKTLQI
jgi:hypothetical protein